MGTITVGGMIIEPDSPEDREMIVRLFRTEGALPGAWGGIAYFGNRRVGVIVGYV